MIVKPVAIKQRPAVFLRAGRSPHRPARPPTATTDERSPHSACSLFDKLAAEHCPVAHVDLAYFPSCGYGWRLRQGSIQPAEAERSTWPTSSRANCHEAASSTRLIADPNPITFETDCGSRLADEPCTGSETGSENRASTTAAGGTGGGLKLLSVPLRLCLSREVPGCCPPTRTSPALQALLNTGHDLPWEVQLAALLLWSCRCRAPTSGAIIAASAAGAAGGDTQTGPCDRSGPARASLADIVATRAGQTDGDGATTEAAFFEFWRRYSSLLPPAEDLTTLLSFQEEELEQLQDPPLASEARAWQRTVLAVYERWIAAGPFLREVGQVAPEEWLWAVGCVESRAFGFRAAADGQELHAYVPFFCLANYAPGAPTLHVLRLAPDSDRDLDLDPEPGTDDGAGPQGCAGSSSGGSTDGDCTSADGGHGPSRADVNVSSSSNNCNNDGCVATSREPTADMMLLPELRLGHASETEERPQQGSRKLAEEPEGIQQQQDQGKLCLFDESGRQIFIDYGKKDNRSLVYQYGFILYGNPYDRIDWGGRVFDSSSRIRRDWVYAVAEQLSHEAEEASWEVAGGGCSRGASGSGVVRSANNGGVCVVQAGASNSPTGESEQSCLSFASGRPVSGRTNEVQPPWICATRPHQDAALLRMGGAAALRRRFRSAAASIVEACGWRNLRERRLVSRQSEQRTLAALSRWVEEQLRGFRTTAEQDAQQLRLSVASAAAAPRITTGGYMADADAAESVGCSGVDRVSMIGRLPKVIGPIAVATGNGTVGTAGVDAPPQELTPRLRLAIEYRLERKLLLLAAFELLRGLRVQGEREPTRGLIVGQEVDGRT